MSDLMDDEPAYWETPKRTCPHCHSTGRVWFDDNNNARCSYCDAIIELENSWEPFL